MLGIDAAACNVDKSHANHAGLNAELLQVVAGFATGLRGDG